MRLEIAATRLLITGDADVGKGYRLRLKLARPATRRPEAIVKLVVLDDQSLAGRTGGVDAEMNTICSGSTTMGSPFSW